MKGKVKGSTYAVLIMLLIACLLTGCKESEEAPPMSSVGELTVAAGEQTEAETSQSSTGNATGRIEPPNVGEMIEALDEQECPKGYVYDYQVSMEPIPEEIAALGGPCQGTIHAFPSKIGMALTELEMEKDPVLKAEVEKRIPEVEAALEKEIGGDFTVDGVILEDELTWVFFCTEVETGYQFDLAYSNFDYYAKINGGITLNNKIYIEDYYDEKESVTIREALIPVLKKYYVDGDFMVRCQSEANLIDIFIALYSSEPVNQQKEQITLLEIWEKLQNYNSETDYNLNVAFYPLEYKEVIEEKYATMFRYDLSNIFSSRIALTLIENEEVWCDLSYSEIIHSNEITSMDWLLQQYQEGNIDTEVEWKYWIQ